MSCVRDHALRSLTLCYTGEARREVAIQGRWIGRSAARCEVSRHPNPVSLVVPKLGLGTRNSLEIPFRFGARTPRKLNFNLSLVQTLQP
jgi:hypothetical protein